VGSCGRDAGERLGTFAVALRAWLQSAALDEPEGKSLSMADFALITLQARGKLRRFVQSNLGQDTDALLASRRGECNRCGACCKILIRCPFLATDAEGQYTCRIYEKRFAQCRLFPLHPEDLREVKECSYTFVSTPETLRDLRRPLAQE
jgi:hypothetical protein